MTDPTTLTEKIARALSESVGGWNQNTAAIQRSAAAILPLVTAAVREGQAEAWDDCADVAGDAMGIGGVPHAAELRGYNPYRNGDTDEHQPPVHP